MTPPVTLPGELEQIITPVFERKALRIKALDVSRLTSYTDTVVIVIGQSSRQVSAIADHVYTRLKKRGMTAIGTEGMDDGEWALLDFGHVIIHIFDVPTGELYDLEGLWSDAPCYDLSGLERQYHLEGNGS